MQTGREPGPSLGTLAVASARISALGLARPVPLLAAAAACALPWLLSSWGAIGIATSDYHIRAVYYELAFLFALLGSILGLARVIQWRWCTTRWRPREILLHEALTLAIPALVLSSLPLLAGDLAGGGILDSSGSVLLLLILSRPLAWGLVLLRLPLPPMALALALLALCWWIPATLAPSFQVGLDLSALLGGGHGGAQAHATHRPWVAETSTLLALLLAARLGLAGERQRR